MANTSKVVNGKDLIFWPVLFGGFAVTGEGDFKTVALTLVLDSSRIGQLAASVYEYPRSEPCRAGESIGEEEQAREATA